VKKLLLCLSLLCYTYAVDTGSIASANASYDGSALILKGQVVLDHGLGKMEADEAVLEKQEVGKEFPFSLIHLNKEVILHLEQTGLLKCDVAELDFAALKGIVRSEGRVLYTDSFRKKKGKNVHLKMVCQGIDLQFLKKVLEGAKPQYGIDQIIAKEKVELTYGDDYILFAEGVEFNKELMNKPSSEFQSHLKSDGTSKCKLVHLADTIEADRFDLDFVQQKLLLINPEGVLPSLSNGELRFSAASLLWDHEKNTLILKGTPSILEPHLGSVSSQGEIFLFQSGKELVGFKCFGPTTLTYLNRHRLVSYGTLSFDRERYIGTVESPPGGEQLLYQENEMAVRADKAHIAYTESEGTFHPVSVALKGQIKIFSGTIENPASYGVADHLTYSPTTRTFVLGADPGKKVLFANPTDRLTISAQEVHITQDPTTKKQTVKGLGAVQLSLSSEEQATLGKYFGSPAS
jgi:lipopolysaccharide export system protein LptA